LLKMSGHGRLTFSNRLSIFNHPGLISMLWHLLALVFGIGHLLMFILGALFAALQPFPWCPFPGCPRWLYERRRSPYYRDATNVRQARDRLRSNTRAPGECFMQLKVASHSLRSLPCVETERREWVFVRSRCA